MFVRLRSSRFASVMTMLYLLVVMASGFASCAAMSSLAVDAGNDRAYLDAALPDGSLPTLCAVDPDAAGLGEGGLNAPCDACLAAGAPGLAAPSGFAPLPGQRLAPPRDIAIAGLATVQRIIRLTSRGPPAGLNG